MPSQRYRQFQLDIQRSRDLVGLGAAIGRLTVGRVDSSDLYRAALVNSVAALEGYVRGVALDRCVAIVLGHSGAGSDDRRMGLGFGAVAAIVGASTPADRELAARTHLASRLSLHTFQTPDDIANVLAMVGIKAIWSAAFGPAAGTTKQALSLIVRRRNHIVHACDGDPLMPGEIRELSSDDGLDAVKCIDGICARIDQLC